ncbi:hypothetical protein [Jiangella anatolica]|uniref:Uncharacterized protein n=1 Tax=Jiangella anatolica TaxID=2670374 RepID=A0A2W2BVE6_9ACTN|nr:hypothetical protein [Jiangella anatolica]PZF83938.1 hypothetical protein C1I92_10795 [Jiangella anatolica]
MNSWDTALLELDDTTLVRIARERRLVLDDGRGPKWVDLCWVDEVALVLIDMANTRREDLTIVYPAPAGQVAVLLAAQLLLRQFVEGNSSSSVGIVTADTSMAARTWNGLRIATTGDRPPIASVFPCHRAGPEGESPGGGRRLQGVIVGQACRGWNVEHLIVDRLAGPVRLDTMQASIEVVADPTDPLLRRAEEAGRAIWGWSEADLAGSPAVEERASHTVPFSVASDRLKTLVGGVDVRLEIARHRQAEAAISRAREDLRLLRSMSPRGASRNLERGLSVAWHHLTTLASLPCRPSLFDSFAGLPPIAARATSTFAAELTAWATTLDEERAEIASILASDIADLRAALELGNPFEEMVRRVFDSRTEGLVVTRTRTAAKALLQSLDYPPTGDLAGSLTVRHIGGLHRQGTWSRAVVVGEPSPWDWHRLLSGLAPAVDVFTLGEDSAKGCAQLVEATRSARDHWGSTEVRDRTWRAIVHIPPPPDAANGSHRLRGSVVLADGAEYVRQPDPFDPLSSLFDLDPLDVGGEGPTRGLARESGLGDWSASMAAIEVVTDRGRLFLEVGRPVDVRDGLRIEERGPELLEPGAVLLIGRRQGRVGLIEALEERLGHRPDLIAARFLLDDYQRQVRSRWAECGLTLTALHRALVDLGCEKSMQAVRSWVTEGTMAPQHFDDLERLNAALGLGLSDVRLQELFAGVKRRRGFRRASGRALAAAARDSTVVANDDRIDDETGLTVADLREAVVEATVLSVVPCDHLVPMTLLGTLEDT